MKGFRLQETNGGTVRELCLVCGLCCDGTIFADVKLAAGDNYAQIEGLQAQYAGAAQAASTGAADAHSPDEGRGLAQGAGGASTASRPAPRLRKLRLPQPCVFFNTGNCACHIYDQRPKHCQDFECLVLQNVKDRRMDLASALRVIGHTREQVAQVKALLAALGDTDHDLALSDRFRRTSKRLERLGLDGEMAEVFGDLTLAVHELNCLVSQNFYNP